MVERKTISEDRGAHTHARRAPGEEPHWQGARGGRELHDVRAGAAGEQQQLQTRQQTRQQEQPQPQGRRGPHHLCSSSELLEWRGLRGPAGDSAAAGRTTRSFYIFISVFPSFAFSGFFCARRALLRRGCQAPARQEEAYTPFPRARRRQGRRPAREGAMAFQVRGRSGARENRSPPPAPAPPRSDRSWSEGRVGEGGGGGLESVARGGAGGQARFGPLPNKMHLPPCLPHQVSIPDDTAWKSEVLNTPGYLQGACGTRTYFFGGKCSKAFRLRVCRDEPPPPPSPPHRSNRLLPPVVRTLQGGGVHLQTHLL